MTLLPTDKDYGEIQAKYPVPELELVSKDCIAQLPTPGLQPFGELAVQDWLIHLSNRMIQARQAYHLMRYFFDLRIPDTRPFISPGKDGASVSYFPDFADQDFSKKAWFDLYADVFGYKLFSAWDTIGQLLAEVYALAVKWPSFHSVASALQKNGRPLGDELLKLWDRKEFERFRNIRHNATHNFLPGTFGGTVTRDKTPAVIELHDGRRVTALSSFSVGVGQYVQSQEIVDIARDALKAFDETLKICALR